MTSPYDLKPKPLFARLEIKSTGNDQAYCVGFELEAWRCDAYADHMIEWIIDYALKSDEIATLSHGNSYGKLRQAAARIYKSENYEKRGEIGEILNCPPFRPDIRHKQKGSSTGLRTGLCLTSIDTLNC